MAYPYKKMTSQDCDYIRSVTAPDRVWVGEEIASEYYRDEMPEYGVYQPDLYVEVVNKEEVSAIMFCHCDSSSQKHLLHYQTVLFHPDQYK